MISLIPALIKVIFVFALILALNKLRLSLSLSLFAGSVVLGLIMRLGPFEMVKSVFFSLISLQTISLILIIWFILVISRLMKESSHLDRILDSFGKITSDARITSLVMPALIGLLPMPGGALFSAPMVQSALGKNNITGEEKTVINYWFRHIWEYWWPLYPGVVLAVALLDVDSWRFMVQMAPMTLVTVIAGIVFILRPVGRITIDHKESISLTGTKGFLWEIMPILIIVPVIIVLACLTALLALFGIDVKISGAVSILPGLVISIIWVCAANHIPSAKVFPAFKDKKIFPMVLLVAAIMVFKGIMVDSHAVIQIRDELVAYNISAMLIILIIPFFSGFITGIAIGFVGISFPLIIPLFPTSQSFDYLSYAALAYTFGYMGMMLSPVHLCFLVTKDFFNANLLRCYRHLILPALAVMAMSVMIFLISRVIGLEL